MDSHESGHSESEFYYPEEMTPINRDEVEKRQALKQHSRFYLLTSPW